jgi:hypothetical protein
MADTRKRRAVKPQAAPEPAQPDEYHHDLHPHTMAGQNIGAAGAHPEKRARTAYDVKDVHARFRDWSDSDLRQIPIVPDGARLEQGATYLDLAASHPREFTATGGMTAGPNQYLVPKSDVPYPLWNRLLGVRNVARTDIAE